MTFSLRARQVAMVTTLVAGSMITLATVNFASLVRHSLDESRTHGELLARTIFHRARLVVPNASDPNGALREDPGIRAVLESSIAYTESVTYAAIVDSEGIATPTARRCSKGSHTRKRRRFAGCLNGMLSASSPASTGMRR